MRWLNKLSEKYDAEVINWRNLLVENLDVFNKQVKIGAVYVYA